MPKQSSSKKSQKGGKESLTRHTILLPSGMFDDLNERYTLFNASEAIRVLVKSAMAGLVDIYQLAKQLDDLESKEEK